MYPLPWKSRIVNAAGAAREEYKCQDTFLEAMAAWVMKGKGKGYGPNAGKGKGPSQQKGTTNGSSVSTLCRCCGRTGHPKKECFHLAKLCRNCGIKGHLAHMCTKDTPAPDTGPKNRVPGANAPSYANVLTANLPWVCQKCNTFSVDGSATCQIGGCNGKRIIVQPPKQSREHSCLSKQFVQACEVLPGTTAGKDAMSDEEYLKAEEILRNQITQCRTLGYSDAEALYADQLKALEKTRPTTPVADLKTVQACLMERVKVQNLIQKSVAAHEEERLKHQKELTDFQTNYVAGQASLAERHKRECEAIVAVHQQRLADMETAELAREARYALTQETFKKGLKTVEEKLGNYGSQEEPKEDVQMGTDQEAKKAPELNDDKQIADFCTDVGWQKIKQLIAYVQKMEKGAAEDQKPGSTGDQDKRDREGENEEPDPKKIK
jgi:hypothetical protein